MAGAQQDQRVRRTRPMAIKSSDGAVDLQDWTNSWCQPPLLIVMQ
jgi:hypothetical protein